MSNTISRRAFLRNIAVVAGGAAVSTPFLGAQTVLSNSSMDITFGEKPNVLFIAVDDLRNRLGCYGNTQVITPNIDQIASDGTVFGRAYCQVPVCGASRASLLTGLRPTTSFSWDARADSVAPNADTLPQHFKNNGYYAIGNGKIFHYVADSADSWSETPWRAYDYDNDGQDWGAANFDKIWLDPDSKNYLSSNGRGPYWEDADVPDDAYEDGKVAMKTIQDLRHLKEIGKPFFLACGFSRPHLPLNAPKKYFDMYDLQQIQLADNRYAIANKPGECSGSTELTGYTQDEGFPSDPDFHRQTLRAYYACVTYVDAMIGKLMDELKALDMDKNTIVVIWGDHGWHLGEHNFWGKHNTLNNALQVPLIVRAPGFKKNNNTDALCELVDLYPTLCELAGLPQPTSHTLAGKSFVPLLKNPDLPWKEAVFSIWGTGKAVVTDRFLYTAWPSGSKMLFDHLGDGVYDPDPDENENRASYAHYASDVSYLQGLLNSL